MKAWDGSSGMCRCPRCGVYYPGTGGGHCMACHNTFASDSAAASHRTGPHSDRRCIDPLTTDGWRMTSRGWTDSAPMPEHLRGTRST